MPSYALAAVPGVPLPSDRDLPGQVCSVIPADKTRRTSEHGVAAMRVGRHHRKRRVARRREVHIDAGERRSPDDEIRERVRADVYAAGTKLRTASRRPTT